MLVKSSSTGCYLQLETAMKILKFLVFFDCFLSKHSFTDFSQIMILKQLKL